MNKVEGGTPVALAPLPELEFSPFEAKVAELVERQPPPERHSARTAIHHLKKAWRIREIDREMAYFRALTGEEEAASAVFRSMKRLKYSGADRLSHRNHVHKNALVPFVNAVRRVLGPLIDGKDPKLEISETGPDAGKLRPRMTITLPNGERQHALLLLPLHYGISLNDEPHRFDEQLQEIASEANACDARAYIRRMANRRNQILYAHDTGIPVAQDPLDGFLQKRRENIFILLALYLMIDQNEGHQIFVQQAIDVLLDLLKLVEKPTADEPPSA